MKWAAIQLKIQSQPQHPAPRPASSASNFAQRPPQVSALYLRVRLSLSLCLSHYLSLSFKSHQLLLIIVQIHCVAQWNL